MTAELASFAERIGLQYVHADSTPCIRRRRCGTGYTYTHTQQGPIHRDHPDRSWIDGLAVPPAWSTVWIAPVAEAHLQFTGYDDADRKQYRYHPRWSSARREAHDAALVEFVERLPRLRAHLDALLDPGPANGRVGRDTAHALAAAVLDETAIRVGNRQSVETHGTRGLTTLEDRHAALGDDRLRLAFRGKGDVEREIRLEDPTICAWLHDTSEHDDAHLFSWEDRHGQIGHVTAASLNRFLKTQLGADAHAHQFRAWHCTWRTLGALRDLDPPSTPSGRLSALLEVLEPIAQSLGHTTSTARGHYLHHRVEPTWVDGSLPRPHPTRSPHLSLPERRAQAVLRVLADSGAHT